MSFAVPVVSFTIQDLTPFSILHRSKSCKFGIFCIFCSAQVQVLQILHILQRRALMAGLVFKLPGGGQEKQPEEGGGWTAIPMENRSPAGSKLQKQLKAQWTSSSLGQAGRYSASFSASSLSRLAALRLKYFGMFKSVPPPPGPDDCRHSELTRKQVFRAP